MRYLIALLVAAVITFALFFTMQALIQTGEGAMSEPIKGNVLDFVRLKKEESVQKKERKPEKPPAPKEPPPPMESPQMDSSQANSDSAGFDFSANVDADVSLAGGLSLDSSDGEYLPIVKVAPVYPRRALSRGIEGYVIVEFIVTKSGTVREPVVVKAEPESLFDQAAKDAVLKFKYKPRVVNGEAVEVAGVQNKITFEISG
ncbi:energy transducer TonB [Pseudoalteromonas tunicata]|jgi:protein TonB|uniref:Protein TonB n=1 Tax=Pseudoalteromonas tunicata D2 TaxID=87626 RepID=A4C3Y9_9GAMM|nr:energy transducer TonB [Pseudoalteromonas tunicata]ATC97245.1 periplasmic protein TonB [Pseudoalteromonas tunicata]AXT33327.1 energy transducer TonB [Pseudoalteromonas tunicata]EAR30271.1 putative TonB2 protein [Pseudoalteromonas tunicata D2]MDP4984375.1 energy transducer TonB [Pseudoalteromonas tunicata]MDP5214423.1 energy transducer TonB [Pseudoalteromonas tunicata]